MDSNPAPQENPTPAPQTMDVVAAPAPEAPAADGAPQETAPETSAPQPTKQMPQQPPKEHDMGVTLAVVATIIIVVVLAALATFAYLKSTK